MRRPWARSALVVLLAAYSLTITFFTPQPADAHAFLLRTVPPADSVVPASLNEVRLTFSERVEVGPDRLVVEDASGHRVDRRDAHVTRGDATVVSASVVPTGNGVYTVRYSFLSADSHVIRGTFRFGIGVPAADVAAGAVTGTNQAAEPLPILDALSRWLNLLALSLLIGPVLLRFILFGWRARAGTDTSKVRALYEERLLRWTRVAVAGLLIAQGLALVAAAASLSRGGLAQALTPDSFSSALVTRFGALWLARVGVILVPAIAIDWLSSARTRAPDANVTFASSATQWSWSIVLGAGLLLVVLTSLGGHAMTTTPVPLSVAIDALHVGATAAWVGGLFALALLLPGLERAAGPIVASSFLAQAAPRLSSVAFWSVELLIVTGLYQTWAHVAQPSELVTTTYGWALVTKLALLVPLFALAGVNRYVLLPRLRSRSMESAPTPESASKLLRANRRVLLGETLLAISVLLVVGMLTALPPARRPAVASEPSPALPPPSALGVTLAGHAGPTLVALTIGPTENGPALVTARLEDIGGQAILAADVRLRASRAGGDGGSTETALVARGGRFLGSLDMSAPGKWHLEVTVTIPGAPPGVALFDIALPTGGARYLLSLADAAMNRLRSLRERQTLSGGSAPVAIDYQYAAPDRIAIRMADGAETIGIGQRRYSRLPGEAWKAEPWPDPGGFRWPDYKYAATAADVVLLGEEVREGVRCWVVTFATPENGARYIFWIGVDDALVRATRMIAPGHYMDAVLSDFDGPVTITEPGH